MIETRCPSIRLALACAAITFANDAGGAAAVATQSSAGTPFPSTAWASTLSSTDLINRGQPTLAGATVGVAHASFPAAGLNDGSSTNDVSGGNTFFPLTSPASFNGTDGTVAATFDLNVSGNPRGYDITSIRSFMGWQGTASGIQANQTYTVSVRKVGSTAYADIATVSYLPFTDLDGTHDESQVTIAEDGGGILASGVSSVRFTFLNPLSSVTGGTGSHQGTVIRELDVHGYPTGSTAPGITLTTPAARQVFQRNAANTGTVVLAGTCQGHPDVIEARMMVTGGAGDTGADTPWMVVATTPAGGSFSGTLPGVTAGGWYRLEVRQVKAGVRGTAVIIPNIGIGDVYVTCGQSNSANHGSPALTAVDDHVSSWNHANGAWSKASDPMPGATGPGGSVWTRLGGLLVARNHVPVAFACLGVGSTSVSQWLPGSGNSTRISTAMKGFPANGFRAVLWHQGESDSLSSTTASVYQERLETVIRQSRADAGWDVPWYVAEAAFHPASKLVQEEPVVAGQLAVIRKDARVFPGPVTDDFHLESKLHDTVHFNAAGLADHADQWDAVLSGASPLALKNGDFESNAPLPDGGSAPIDTNLNASPSVIGWRALSSDGSSAADGSCGYANPGDSWYPGTKDAAGGVVNGMSGRHIAFISGSSAGTQFLQTRRAMAKGGTTYTLRIAFGARATTETFGGASVELLADGAVLKSLAVSRSDLDALHAGNAAGTFSEFTLQAVTPVNLPEGKPLAVRIRKTGGAGTYLDFDHVRLE